jgi:hypothetical protein
MWANGFAIGLLVIRAGLVEAGSRTLGVVRLAITEKGGQWSSHDALGSEFDDLLPPAQVERRLQGDEAAKLITRLAGRSRKPAAPQKPKGKRRSKWPAARTLAGSKGRDSEGALSALRERVSIAQHRPHQPHPRRWQDSHG